MLPISLAVILFCRLWHGFTSSRLHTVCESVGIQLSDELKPIDPSMASTYNDFKATHWYKPSNGIVHTAFFVVLVSMTTINVFLENGTVSFNAVVSTMAIACALYSIRCNQHARKSSYGIEVVNVI